MPLLAALVTMPTITRELGTDRLGVLTLGWMATGYFNLFDLGLGRALTKLIAERRGTERHHEIPELIRPGLVMMTMLGVLGGAVMAAISPWLVHNVLNVPPTLQDETLASFLVLACCVPFVILTAGLRGVLEGLHQFSAVNLIRAPMGIWQFVSPVLGLLITRSLLPAMLFLLLGRVLGTLAHAIACWRAVPGVASGAWFTKRHVRELVHFGSWMTVSSIVSPVMMSMDRFLVGALITMQAVAYYATAYELASRVLLVPAAIVSVLFPLFSESYAADRQETSILYDRATRIMWILLIPACLVIATLARPVLTFWLGSDFADNTYWVMGVVAAGVAVNGVANVSTTLIQAMGRPDLTARIHLIELPLYLGVLYVLTAHFGIIGTAIAWTLRVVGDTIVLMFMSRRLLDNRGPGLVRAVTPWAFLVVSFVVGMGPFSTAAKMAYLGIALPGFAAAAWFLILTSKDRAHLLAAARRLLS